jgi:hypothetical protein
LGGEVELMLISEGYDMYLGYLRKLQQRIHGMAVFDKEDWVWARRNRAGAFFCTHHGPTIPLE